MNLVAKLTQPATLAEKISNTIHAQSPEALGISEQSRVRHCVMRK